MTHPCENCKEEHKQNIEWFKNYQEEHKKVEKIWNRVYFLPSATTGVIAGLMLIAWCFYPEVFKIGKIILSLAFIY